MTPSRRRCPYRFGLFLASFPCFGPRSSTFYPRRWSRIFSFFVVHFFVLFSFRIIERVQTTCDFRKVAVHALTTLMSVTYSYPVTPITFIHYVHPCFVSRHVRLARDRVSSLKLAGRARSSGEGFEAAGIRPFASGGGSWIRRQRRCFFVFHCQVLLKLPLIRVSSVVILTRVHPKGKCLENVFSPCLFFSHFAFSCWRATPAA